MTRSRNPVRDANGDLVFIQGSAGRGKILEHNKGSATGAGTAAMHFLPAWAATRGPRTGSQP